MAKIFFSYRRIDSRDETLALWRAFAKKFGLLNRPLDSYLPRKHLFMDIETMDYREGDFRKQIQRFIVLCDTVLVIIGPNWLPELKRRLGTGEPDWVRVEVEFALMHDKRVIPVLVNGANMPNWSELPEEMRQLTTKHAATIRIGHEKEDIQVLASRLNPARGFQVLQYVFFVVLLLIVASAISGSFDERGGETNPTSDQLINQLTIDTNQISNQSGTLTKAINSTETVDVIYILNITQTEFALQQTVDTLETQNAVLFENAINTESSSLQTPTPSKTSTTAPKQTDTDEPPTITPNFTETAIYIPTSVQNFHIIPIEAGISWTKENLGLPSGELTTWYSPKRPNIPFEIGRGISTYGCSEGTTDSIELLTKIQKPIAVHFLLQAGNAYKRYEGTEIGTINLIFSDGYKSESLILGNNIRDWKLISGVAITSVTSNLTIEAWSDEDGRIDLLTIPLNEINDYAMLERIEIKDSSDSAPCIHITAVTVETDF